MAVYEPSQAYLEKVMRWLRANGITEEANQIGQDVHVDGGLIKYRTVVGTGIHTNVVSQTVTFAEANQPHG